MRHMTKSVERDKLAAGDIPVKVFGIRERYLTIETTPWDQCRDRDGLDAIGIGDWALSERKRQRSPVAGRAVAAEPETRTDAVRYREERNV
jgi:hypothetical protein